jgi:phosphoribosylaminoimidazolecarboxamide formyltransferase / IMP cyclohydrolase
MTARRALISVSDKTGAVELGCALAELGFEILSTGGSAQALRAAGCPVVEVGAYTGFPEILDGRVKTLHPRVHGGLLGRPDLPEHVEQMAAHGIEPISVVAVNLYPFRETIAKPGCTLDDAIENIDIGGPAMVRASAKNWAHVAVITDPADYAEVVAELRAHRGTVGDALRFRLACKAFAHTAAYDGAIANYLTSLDASGTRKPFPSRLFLDFDKVDDLRYGENPHQQAAFYRERQPVAGAISACRQLQGKELSYNNIADADAAWECVKAFDAPTCVIVKHANPCGVAQAEAMVDAYARAFATDPTSAFGGIIALNGEVDADTARAASAQFLEVIVAPSYSKGALEILATKANVRVLEVPLARAHDAYDLKRIGGGLLVQTPDADAVGADRVRVVTKRTPTPSEMNDLLFAFRVAKFVKSNAIVFCGGGRTLGVGAGQMSRVDSTRIASSKARHAGLSLSGAVVASDAFFPFRDGIDVLAEAGAAAVIQPGGSVRDAEVIEAADEHGIAMVFTGIRHFRH